jgi:hypothetical protein
MVTRQNCVYFFLIKHKITLTDIRGCAKQLYGDIDHSLFDQVPHNI